MQAEIYQNSPGKRLCEMHNAHGSKNVPLRQYSKNWIDLRCQMGLTGMHDYKF